MIHRRQLTKIFSVLKIFFENSDILICFIFLFGGFSIIYLSYFSGIGQYGMGFAFFFGAVIYLYLKKFRINFIEFKEGLYSYRKRKLLILNILFFTCISLSNIILYNSLYFRPAAYFVLITIGFSTIFIEIFLIKGSYFNWLIICKILLLSLMFRASRFFTFPIIPGYDTQFHISVAKYIINTGYVPGYDIALKYTSTPLWHIFEAQSGIILSTNFQTLLFYTVAAPFIIILSLFLFILVKETYHEKVGLISVILLNVANMIFVRGVTSIYTCSLVHCFFIIMLYSLIKEKKEPFPFITLVVIYAMILTHQLTTFFVFLIFIGLLLGRYFFALYNVNPLKYSTVKNGATNISLNTILLFFVSLITQWSFTGLSGDNLSFFDKVTYRLVHTLTRMYIEYTSQSDILATSYGNYFSQYSVLSNLLYSAGNSILMAFAVIGLLLIISNKNKFTVSFSYICATAILFTFIYIFTYIGLDQVFIPHRVLSFYELFLVIFASYSIYVIYTALNKAKWQQIMFILVFTSFIFLMLTTPFINRNDPLYCSDRDYRTELTLSELSAIGWSSTFQNNEVLYVDPLINRLQVSNVEILNVSDANLQSFQYNQNTENPNSNILLRNYFLDNQNFILCSTFGISEEYSFNKYVDSVINYDNLIYSVDSVRIYKKT